MSLTIEGPGLDRRPGTNCTVACSRLKDDASGGEDCRPAPGSVASCPTRRRAANRKRRTTNGVRAARATCRTKPVSSWASGCCPRAGPCPLGLCDRRRRCILRSDSADCRTTNRYLRRNERRPYQYQYI